MKILSKINKGIFCKLFQGVERKKENYHLAKVINVLSIIRKPIFAHVFAQGGVGEKPIEMYRSMEFMSRINLLLDKTIYHVGRGYEEAVLKTITMVISRC